jgi:CRISPR-associated exonuclease Cas4
MNVVLALALVVGALVYLVLCRLQSRRRASLGLTDGELVAADDSVIGSPTLRSDQLGLVGGPDHLVRVGRHVVPVEQKPRARRVHQSHMMQLAAECLLVEQTYGVRPPYGMLVLAGGVRRRVPFTRDLEERLLETVDRMHSLLESGVEPGPRWLGARCRACGFFATCWD